VTSSSRTSRRRRVAYRYRWLRRYGTTSHWCQWVTTHHANVERAGAGDNGTTAVLRRRSAAATPASSNLPVCQLPATYNVTMLHITGTGPYRLLAATTGCRRRCQLTVVSLVSLAASCKLQQTVPGAAPLARQCELPTLTFNNFNVGALGVGVGSQNLNTPSVLLLSSPPPLVHQAVLSRYTARAARGGAHL